MTNPYQPPEIHSPSSDTQSRPLFLSISAIVILMLTVVTIIVSRIRFWMLFGDFGVELPTLTIVALSPAVVVVAVLALMGSFMTVVFVRNRRTAIFLQVGFVMFAVALLLFYLFFTFLPLVSLTRNLS